MILLSVLKYKIQCLLSLKKKKKSSILSTEPGVDLVDTNVDATTPNSSITGRVAALAPNCVMQKRLCGSFLIEYIWKQA